MITLSPLTLRDVPFFNAVRNASREWLHDPTAFTLPQSAEWFQREECQFLIILLDGLPVGYCRVSDGNDAEEKYVGMDIHPDYRGRGLARPAYAVLLATLRAGGVKRFRLRVLKRNERARHLYDTLGFVPVAEMSDEVEMALDMKVPFNERAP